jgi:hypothetical protein
LIEAIADAPTQESEPEWLEWKSAVELSEKRWAAEIARHIIGFANRLPDKAARTAGGFAYLVLGVEPQNVCGVSAVDNADLEAAVASYTGRDGPQRSPEYIEVGGHESSSSRLRRHAMAIGSSRSRRSFSTSIG